MYMYIDKVGFGTAVFSIFLSYYGLASPFGTTCKCGLSKVSSDASETHIYLDSKSVATKVSESFLSKV